MADATEHDLFWQDVQSRITAELKKGLSCYTVVQLCEQTRAAIVKAVLLELSDDMVENSLRMARECKT